MKKVSISIHAIENFTTDILKGFKGLDYIHVDVFDGKFVQGFKVIEGDSGGWERRK